MSETNPYYLKDVGFAASCTLSICMPPGSTKWQWTESLNCKPSQFNIFPYKSYHGMMSPHNNRNPKSSRISLVVILLLLFWTNRIWLILGIWDFQYLVLGHPSNVGNGLHHLEWVLSQIRHLSTIPTSFMPPFPRNSDQKNVDHRFCGGLVSTFLLCWPSEDLFVSI